MLDAGVNADLLHPDPNAGHWLPIGRLEPRWTRQSWNPAIFRTSSGKALIASRESPSHIKGFSLMPQYTNT